MTKLWVYACMFRCDCSMQIFHMFVCFSSGTRLVSNALRILARLGSIILSVLTLWIGLALGEQQELDLQAGNFNTPVVRLAVLGGILALQMYLTFKVINQEITRSRENSAVTTVPKAKTQRKEKSKKSK